MKNKCALIISTSALVLPICLMLVMLFVEPEIAEAIHSGLFFGSAFGSVLGGVALSMNKGESGLINIFSVMPMCLLVFYLLLLLP